MPDDIAGRACRGGIELPPVLDRAAAGALRQGLLEAVAAGGCINVDASAVQRITTPCLQVLAAASKSAALVDGCRLRLHSVPLVMSETIRMLGLAESVGTGEAWR